MSYTPIPSLPTPPNSITRPGTFVADSDATFGALPATVEAIKANLPLIDAAAQAAPGAIAAANFKGKWAGLAGPLAIPATVAYGPDDQLYMLLESVADVTAHVPGVSTKWKSLKEKQRGAGGATASGSVVLTASSVGAHTLTPSGYGACATLPDATTMQPGVGAFALNNASAYPMRVLDSASKLLGFIPPQGRVQIDLVDNATSAGVWGVGGSDPIGTVAMKQGTGSTFTDAVMSLGFGLPQQVIELDADTRFLWTHNNNVYGCVYKKSTGDIGNPTVIASFSTSINKVAACRISNTQVLLVTINAGANLEAVVLTVTGTSIAVGTPVQAAVASLESLVGVVAVNGSFVVAYGTSTPVAYLRAVTVAGTVPTFGTAATWTNGHKAVALFATGLQGLLFAYKSTATEAGQAVPFTVSGLTVTVGTVATWATTTNLSWQIARVGSRFVVASTAFGALVSVSANVATASSFAVASSWHSSAATSRCVIPLSSTQALLLYGDSIPRMAMVTDTGGTASIGSELNVVSGWTPVAASVVRVDSQAFTVIYDGYQTDGGSNFTLRRIATRVGFSTGTLQVLGQHTSETDVATQSLTMITRGSTMPALPINNKGSWSIGVTYSASSAAEQLFNRDGGKCSYLVGRAAGICVVDDLGIHRQQPCNSLEWANPFPYSNSGSLPGNSNFPLPVGARLNSTEAVICLGTSLLVVECVA